MSRTIALGTSAIGRLGGYLGLLIVIGAVIGLVAAGLLPGRRWAPFGDLRVWRFLLEGLWVTVQIGAVALVASLVLAVPLALARLSLPPAVRWLDQIEAAERGWQEQPVSHYRIYVSIHSQSYQAIHDLIVRHDQILSYTFTCTLPSAGCRTPHYPAETFTIAGLFAIARAHTGRAGATYSTIAFDPTYHFPTLITYDHPGESGEEESWQVNSFIVLE